MEDPNRCKQSWVEIIFGPFCMYIQQLGSDPEPKPNQCCYLILPVLSNVTTL